jgi:hypothetical protein
LLKVALIIINQAKPTFTSFIYFIYVTPFLLLQSFDNERSWRCLLQKHVVCTKLDIYVFKTTIWSCYIYKFLHKHSFDNFCIDLRSTRWQELLLTDNYSLTSIGCLLGTQIITMLIVNSLLIDMFIMLMLL